jgi:hypothetical protein
MAGTSGEKLDFDDALMVDFRVPVKQWLDEAMQLAAFKIEPPTQLTQPPSDPRFEEPDFFPVIPTDEQFSRFQEEFAEKARRPRRGSPLTDENLQVTATVYREALERGIPPTEHVAKVSHVTRSTS